MTLPVSRLTASEDRMTDANDLKGSIILYLRYHPSICLEDLKNVRTNNVLTRITTKYLLNTNLKCYF
jgi:hypothetical protein